jgi:hypothetical protein
MASLSGLTRESGDQSKLVSEMVGSSPTMTAAEMDPGPSLRSGRDHALNSINDRVQVR